MNAHTPKWIPTLGIGIFMEFWIFNEQFQGLKLIGRKISLYHSKDLEMEKCKMALHDAFEYL
jgi:hypothetical protein